MGPLVYASPSHTNKERVFHWPAIAVHLVCGRLHFLPSWSQLEPLVLDSLWDVTGVPLRWCHLRKEKGGWVPSLRVTGVPAVLRLAREP